MKVISLGWGVQSWTLAAMSALGEIERVDAVIHSDTTHERSGTYSFAEKWTPWLEERGLKVVTVNDAPKGEIDKWGGLFIPAFTDTPGESGGQLRRQCTQRWKIAPLRRWLQANRNREPVEMWLGISLDEYKRMRPSDVKYITNRWPLIEMKMTRWDCKLWLEAHELEIPPKSACTFCPYHDQASWREIKLSGNGDWEKAVQVDDAIRKARPPYDLFVHPARIPLVDVDLRNEADRGQISLWDDECEGVCGV